MRKGDPLNALWKRGTRSLIDVAIIISAWVLAWWLRFDRELPAEVYRLVIITTPYVVLLKYAALRALRIHRHSWRYTSFREVVTVCLAMGLSSGVFFFARTFNPLLRELWWPLGYARVPYSVMAIDFALVVLGLVGIRAIRRAQIEAREQRGMTDDSGSPATRVLLIGAGRAGIMVARELRNRRDLGIEAVGFVDDDPHKQREIIHGIPVVGKTPSICDIKERYEVDEAIITMANVDGRDVRRIVELCKECDLETKIIPGIYEIVGGQVNLSRIRPVEIEDLLRRDPVELETSTIERYVNDDVVLVTGAGGSIGAELCRQIARFHPRRLVLVEQAEPALWAIQRELEEEFAEVAVVPLIADVCDRERMDQILTSHRPTTVFHAAAHKHVPMMEWNPGEAVKNNVFGTRTVADLAVERGVTRFVLISTDKAVNPTSVMGATKRVAERYVQHLAHTHGRAFVSVRFGNVLGSTGSVIPIFEEQIEEGGPVTVTHPDMTRYFMTIPEAAQLVLQAGGMGTGGEIFVLDMGEPVKIVDLAHDLIRLSGLRPGDDIGIRFTGIRDGEKLYEELSLSEENADRTRHPKVWIGRNPSPDWVTVNEDLLELESVGNQGTRDEIRAMLRHLAPEYTPAELIEVPDEEDEAPDTRDGAPVN